MIQAWIIYRNSINIGNTLSRAGEMTQKQLLVNYWMNARGHGVCHLIKKLQVCWERETTPKSGQEIQQQEIWWYTIYEAQ